MREHLLACLPSPSLYILLYLVSSQSSRISITDEGYRLKLMIQSLVAISI
jgi:hypothetical protein